MSWLPNDGLMDSARLAAVIAERGIKPYKPPWYKRWWPYRFWKWLDRKIEEPPMVSGIGPSHSEMQEKGRQELMREAREKEEAPKVPTIDEVHKALSGDEMTISKPENVEIVEDKGRL